MRPALTPSLEAGFGPATFAEILQWRASQDPGRRAYTFVVDGEREEIHVTYGELDQRARAIAHQLLLQGAVCGDRVILLHPPGLDFIASFFGCLYAGVVAVPAYPPHNSRSVPRILAILASARVRVGLTTTSLVANLQRLLHSAASAPCALEWIATDDPAACRQHARQSLPLCASELALLQYTSGSTGTPKGVMLTHRNLLTNSSLIQRSFNGTADSRIVSWLPPYHDMGLIGCLLEPVYCGAHATLMSPVSFLQRPLRWLETISRTRATHSGGPNFGYELCLRKITPEQRARLDLRSWRVAFNGAEPVRADTLASFAAMFESCGFRPEALLPCYGLAEATLLVSARSQSRTTAIRTVQSSALEHNRIVHAAPTDVGSRVLVGCGEPMPEQNVVIVDPETRTTCPPSTVGEIWVAGGSVAEGYWDLPEQTARTFDAYLSDTGEGPFLRTGDLGFLDRGELFVTGRLKDLIIICGRNLYPQDLEVTAASSHPSLHSGSAAAFSVLIEGEERLVIVQEHGNRHGRETGAAIKAIRSAVAEEHGVQVHSVELIKPGALPKTSSGKVQRYDCKSRFLAGTLAKC